MCAQECQNNGHCIAPDTCKCWQWSNPYVDGRAGGGRPLFQDEDGFALPTGIYLLFDNVYTLILLFHKPLYLQSL